MSRPRLLLLAVPAALLLAALAPGRWWEAATLLWTLSDGARPGQVLRQATAAGDLYRTGEAARAGIVLLSGVSPQGKDDPRLVRFAEALATARFAVLAPEPPGLRALRVSAADAAHVTEAVRALRRQGVPVGVGAFSYAVGPAILAALELGPEVAFVLAIGGYHDLTRVVRHFTTGPADPRAKWLFARANAARLERPQDRQALAVMANRKLADDSAPVADLMGDFGPDGRAVVALVANRDPARVSDLLAALPPSVARELAALDLARRDLGRLAAPALLVHGRDDPVVPVSESESLARALPRAELYVLDDLRHVDAGWTLRDAFAMLRAAEALLRLRDARPLG